MANFFSLQNKQLGFCILFSLKKLPSKKSDHKDSVPVLDSLLLIEFSKSTFESTIQSLFGVKDDPTSLVFNLHFIPKPIWGNESSVLYHFYF